MNQMHILIRELRQLGGTHAECAAMLEDLQAREKFDLSYVRITEPMTEPYRRDWGQFIHKPPSKTEYRLYVWYPEGPMEFRADSLLEVLQREREHDDERRKAVDQCN